MNINALKNPDAYPHSADDIKIIETHISIIVLTGPFAYKLKKPLNLGFLDFSTLTQRKFFCEEEIRLNQRYAAEIYLSVVAITGTLEQPTFGGSGKPIEYAVKMVQFSQDQLLDRMLDNGELQPSHIDELAQLMAKFHNNIQSDPATIPFDFGASVEQPVHTNFKTLADRLDDPQLQHQLAAIQTYADATLQQLKPILQQRAKKGFVRECHGDLHLGNIACINGQITLFDGIEFSERLRWIDVMSELAFLIMDLEARDQPALAHRALNRYLQHTGDYRGLSLLRYFQCYRAMVRAKIAAIRQDQLSVESVEYAVADQSLRRYLTLAERYTQPSSPWLAITMGLSGSGKTTLTQPLLEQTGAVRIRSDVERKRLFGLGELESSQSELKEGIYHRTASIDTYQHLLALSEALLEAGFSVIVDATFLQTTQRQPFIALAKKRQVPLAILHFEANHQLLKQRIETRQQRNQDASEATVEVLQQQIKTAQPLSANEKKFAIAVDASGDLPTELLTQLNLRPEHPHA